MVFVPGVIQLHCSDARREHSIEVAPITAATVVDGLGVVTAAQPLASITQLSYST
jgi:hypothetical protein